MVLACTYALPLTLDERARARGLEVSIDRILRDAGRGAAPPVFEAVGLREDRVRNFLIEAYARAGWAVSTHRRYEGDRLWLSFAPNIAYLVAFAPSVADVARFSWKY